MVFLQVISRYLEIPLAGTEELARFMIIWLTFIGTSLAIHEKIHLAVKYFVSLVNENLQKMINILVDIIIIILFAILGFYGFDLTLLSMGTSSSALQVPMGLVYSIIPITAVFSILFLSANILNVLKKGVASS
nr:TRAP transporter small permease subunit [Lentibacillus sp. CBA3610]